MKSAEFSGKVEGCFQPSLSANQKADILATYRRWVAAGMPDHLPKEPSEEAV